MTSSKSKSWSPRRARLRIEPWRAAIWEADGFYPHPGQIAAFNNYLLHRYNWVCAGKRGGKSDFAGRGIIWPEFIRDEDTVGEVPMIIGDKVEMVREGWPKKILIAVPYYKQAKIIFGKVHRLAMRNGIPLRTNHFTTQEMEIETTKGAVIACQTGKNIMSAPGHAWDLVVADEMPIFPGDPEEVFDEILFPTLLDSMGSFFGIGTPDFPGSYTYDLMLKGKDPAVKRWGFAHWTTYDNWHMPHFKAELDEIRLTMPDDIFRRTFLAQYVPREGLVYPEAATCVMSEKEARDSESYIMDNAEFYRAIDFGFANPFACITVAIIGDHVYAWDEYYRTQRHLNQHRVVLAKFDERYTYKLNISDPAEPQSIRLLAAYRYTGPKGKRSLGGGWVTNYAKPKIVDRIDLVRRIMSAGLLRIHPRCRELISEYGLEKYPSRRAMRNYDENPIDADNHGTSAVGYLLDFLYGAISGDTGPLSEGEKSDAEKALTGY